MDKKQENKLFQMLPVLVFIGSYFIFHLFDWSETTQTILAVFLCLLSFFFLAADLKIEHKDKGINFQKLNFYSGVLTLIFLLIFLQGFLHWRGMISLTYRMLVQYGLLLVYFIFLFRAMNVLMQFKMMAESKKKE